MRGLLEHALRGFGEFLHGRSAAFWSALQRVHDAIIGAASSGFEADTGRERTQAQQYQPGDGPARWRSPDTFEAGDQRREPRQPLFELLDAVRDSGSIHHAAKSLGCSYRFLWGRCAGRPR
jgi:hypothetical protein